MALSNVEVTTATGDDGVTVVSVKGAIVTNLSGTEVAPLMENLMKSGRQPHTILSLANVRYLDSYSFIWIIKLMNDIEKLGGAFAISDPNDDILALFDLSSFGKAVPVYRTETEAHAAILSGNDAARIANT